MGCCASLPEQKFPDPEPCEPCVFTVKASGFMGFGDDCYAYKGDSTADDDRWLFLDKIKPRERQHGSERLLELQNFKRAEGEKKGEVLLKALFDSKPAFHVMSKSEFSQTQLSPAWAMQFSKAVLIQIPQCAGFFDVTMPSGVTIRAVPPVGSQPGMVMFLADPGAKTPDGVYFDKAKTMMHSGSFRSAKLKKFASTTAATITPGTRCQQFPGGFQLDIYVEGTTVVRYYWTPPHTDSEGHHHRGHWSKTTKAVIDQTCFQLLQKNEGGVPQTIAAWSCPGELEGGDVTQENALFSTMLEGGWASKKLIVTTKEYWDPCLALVISYLTSKEYSPDELKSDFGKTFSWPSGPSGHRGSRRGSRSRGGRHEGGYDWDGYDDYNSDRESHSPAGIRISWQ